MKLRREVNAPPLSDSVVAALLKGWRAVPPGGREDGPPSDDMFDLMLMWKRGASVASWFPHVPYILEKAREWGWQPDHELMDGTPCWLFEAHLERLRR